MSAMSPPPPPYCSLRNRRMMQAINRIKGRQYSFLFQKFCRSILDFQARASLLLAHCYCELLQKSKGLFSSEILLSRNNRVGKARGVHTISKTLLRYVPHTFLRDLCLKMSERTLYQSFLTCLYIILTKSILKSNIFPNQFISRSFKLIVMIILYYISWFITA